jgi:hypothetical protein
MTTQNKIALDDLLVSGGREALLACEQIPLSSPLFAVARRREERRQERSKNGQDDSLREAIRQTILDQDLKGFDKKRTAADLIRQHLIEHGEVYRTADGRFFFFSYGECRLYDLEQQPFTRLLIDESGLSTTETFFNFALDTLTAHISRRGKLVEVRTPSHYDVHTKVLTVSNGGGGVWRRERCGKWQEGKNGDNGILFFTEPEAAPWVPDFKKKGNLTWLLSQINFCSVPRNRSRPGLIDLMRVTARKPHQIRFSQKHF